MLSIKLLPIDSLIPYISNSRTHHDKQIDQIAGSIKEFGFTNPLLIDQDKGIIAGHGRLLAARKLGLTEVPTIELPHLTKAQKKAYIIADNKIALNAGWNNELLINEIRSLQDEGFDIELTGFDIDEIADLAPFESHGGLSDEDDVPEIKEEAICKTGEIWLLGNHRLMCGDSTLIDSVDRLMNGEKADMVFTDPPYNLAEKTQGIASHAPTNKQNKKLMDCEWDKSFKFNLVCDCLWSNISENCSIYVCCSHYTAPDIWKWMQETFKFYSYCIWSKPNPFPSLMKRHWAFNSEIICYATSGTHTFNYPEYGNELSVWNIAIGEGGLHPTQKPVAVPQHAILHSSNENFIILDLFGGSGTTLIACEKTNRKCFMMEIAPVYCDVIIKRWQTFIGKDAILESSQQTFNELEDEEQRRKT
jgi:DNA modification methylase